MRHYPLRRYNRPSRVSLGFRPLAAPVVLLVLVLFYRFLDARTDLPLSVSRINRSFTLIDADESSFDHPVIHGMRNSTPLSFNLPYESAWREHPHLVVFAVLSTDQSTRRSMRNNQRTTWLRYPGVASRPTSFKGLMLVLYVTAPQGHQTPFVSDAMLDEMEKHYDVLMLRIMERQSSVASGGSAHRAYELGLQVSNSRKVLLYMMYAYHAFPSTPFIAKGDDDSYVYVPEYMRMLKQLPRESTIYSIIRYVPNPSATHPARSMIGCGYTVSRDIAKDTLTEPRVAALLPLPFSDSSVGYSEVYFHWEDIIVGAAMHRRYYDSNATRAQPEPPHNDARLPPVEGWGKAYMAYLRDPLGVLRTGRAVSSDGRYNMTYTFPPPETFAYGNILWVGDNCRFHENMQRPNATRHTRYIITHRSVTVEDYDAHWQFHSTLGEDEHMERPSHIDVVAGDSTTHITDAKIQHLEACSASDIYTRFR